MEKEMEVFVQCEGVKDVVLVKVASDGVVGDLILQAKAQGLLSSDENNASSVFLEEGEEALSSECTLVDAGVSSRCHVHIHRCNVVKTTINFNGQEKSRSFPVSSPISTVKKWATQVFQMTDVDAAEHVLQVAGTKNQPDVDTHVGTLVVCPDNQITFDLVPKIRIEG